MRITQVGNLINLQLVEISEGSYPIVKHLFNFTIEKEKYKDLKKDIITALKEFKPR